MCRTRSTSSLSVFCVKQETAYEMRISDWSSDVCSSDLGLTVCCAGLVLAGRTAASSSCGAVSSWQPLSWALSRGMSRATSGKLAHNSSRHRASRMDMGGSLAGAAINGGLYIGCGGPADELGRAHV